MPKFFQKCPDGGKDSGSTAYFLIEWKPYFSIALLKFEGEPREAFHNHAFNALTWFIKGNVLEYVYHEPDIKLAIDFPQVSHRVWKPSFWPKFTPRNLFHKIAAISKTAWALTIRGPWNDTWQEIREGKPVTLTHGRKVVEDV